MPTDPRRDAAADLLELGAVVLRPDEPFTWASGLKSPIYCDNRLTMGAPDLRERLTERFKEALSLRNLQPDVIAGTATAGIPHAAWLAHRMRLPLVYVRSKPKAHGRGNQVEGRLHAGDRVVLVEDTVSTGGSAVAAVGALREAGAEVLAVLAIFSYGFAQAERAFEGAGVPLRALTTYDDLVGEAERTGLVSMDDLATLAAWRSDPEGWSAARG